MTYCNWFWGSHGCDVPPPHDGYHLCGTEDKPCSKHNGTQVQYHYVGGEWSGEWDDLPGFCNPGPCGDPKHCNYHGEPWHNEPRRDFQAADTKVMHVIACSDCTDVTNVDPATVRPSTTKPCDCGCGWARFLCQLCGRDIGHITTGGTIDLSDQTNRELNYGFREE